MKRTLASQTVKKVGREVLLAGWVATRRDHGELVFIDFRDASGIVQVVGDKNLSQFRPEDVIEVVGRVRQRPKEMVNPKLATGKVEVAAKRVQVLAKAADLPIPIEGEGYDIEEEKRLKYRYLDLRRPRLQENLKLRHKIIKFIRDWLDKQGFVEIETPMLTKTTPEGARDFIVPSRLQPGKFYALPQSPQQYKQLLMVAGFEKYYQIARCIRDEDLRAHRQLEFTQLDLEMAYVSQEDILKLSEALFTDLTEAMGKKVYRQPFPRIKYKEAMKKYGDDKFDLRAKKDPDTLAFAWVIDQPLFEWREEEKRWHPMHHPFTAPRPADVSLLERGKIGQIRSLQHDLVCNGWEIGGGSIRITDPAVQEQVFAILGYAKAEIEEKFGHLLEAYKYGAPSHGGIAPGLDRIIALFAGEEAIREVMAFPVTSSGQTSVMDSPSEVDSKQLEELGIALAKKKR